ncbi:hypothetical protein [Streptomyces sp. NPDC002215]|uniref:hypothetical protein n=1 Tax=Streptomyces sp. NPDC002215 TaxID=3154412 RepID=UPI003318B13B
MGAQSVARVLRRRAPRDGFPVTDELLARLSPLQYDHINFPGRCAFTRPAAPILRRLRDPHSDDESSDSENVQQLGTTPGAASLLRGIKLRLPRLDLPPGG